MRNDDTVDAPNGNNSDDSDEDHWFSDESEGVMLVTLFILHNFFLYTSNQSINVYLWYILFIILYLLESI